MFRVDGRQPFRYAAEGQRRVRCGLPVTRQKLNVNGAQWRGRPSIQRFSAIPNVS
jgi:hypothetical protein